ncbi:hypothetical protein FHY55_04555 [Oceanicola sp. D3]|uniref:hypothetical protein n=1 Tax=Oceanicola sp. D3 TaxID=2587163 RepID=UPI00112447B5|nr:hypothetical protein [Oceanicola sp. D3]QDC08555.1 hypothetical protein FHY55_04555 [Oceanicola sp. D3]
MPANNPRLRLRLFALIALFAALAVGVGLPLFLKAQGGTVADPEGLRSMQFAILGGGIGLAIALFVMSFFSKKG